MFVIFIGFAISIYGQVTEILWVLSAGDILMICGIVLMIGCFIAVGYEQSHDSWGRIHK
jgi:hypothetical protein